MAEKIGKMKICDRCGRKIFLELIKTDELDGGFTHVPKYEDTPEGWVRSYDLGMTLCPDCNDNYQFLIKTFKGE